MESDRLNALRLVAIEVCYTDPDTALGLLIETISVKATIDPFGGVSQGESLERALAATRPVETLAALAGTEGFENKTKQIVAYWVEANPQQASTWLRDQPAGPRRDAMVHGLVDGMLREGNPDFASAAIWALSLPAQDAATGHNQQRYVLRNVFQNWLERDRATALEAMAHEGMPPEVRAMYEEEVRNQP